MLYLTPEIKTLFESDDLDEIGYLLRNGLDVNSLDNKGANAIFRPTCGLEKTQFLINRGLDFKFISEDGMNALFSQRNMSQPFDKFKFLIEKGVNFKQIANYIIADSCFRDASIEIAEYLFKYLNFDIHYINEYGYNLINSSKIEVCEWLVNHKVDIFHLSKKDNNTLFFNNDNETMKYLIHLGVDPFHISKITNENLLFHASLEDTKYLCDLGLSPQHKNKNNEICLMHADFETVQYLVEEKSVNIHHVDSDGNNIIYHKNDNLDIIKYALDKQVSIFGQQSELNNKYMLSESPSYLIPFFIKLGFLEHENFKSIIFNNKMNKESSYLYISSYLEKGGNVNITEKKKNLFMTHADNEKVNNLLLNKDINIFYYFESYFYNENMLNYCWHLSTYNLLIEKGFFSHPKYQLIKHYFSFGTLRKLKSKELYQKFINNKYIDFSRDNEGNNIFSTYFNSYKVKYFIQQGAGVNDNQCHFGKNYVPLSFNHIPKNLMSLIRNGADVNFYTNEECIIDTLKDVKKNYYKDKKYNLKNPEFQFMKFLVKYGFSTSKIQYKYGTNYRRFQRKFIDFIYQSSEKQELFKMFKKDIYTFEFGVISHDKDLFKDWFVFNNEFFHMTSLEYRNEVLLFLIKNANSDIKKYTKQIIYIFDNYPEYLSTEFLSNELIINLITSSCIKESAIQHKTQFLISQFLESKSMREFQEFIFNSNFYLPEFLLSKIPDEILMQLNNKDENILFYNNNEDIILYLINRGANINHLSMNQQNCCTFRLKKNLELFEIEEEDKAEKAEKADKEVEIIIKLLKAGVDYNIKDNSNQNYFEMIQKSGDKHINTRLIKINIAINKLELQNKIKTHSTNKITPKRI